MSKIANVSSSQLLAVKGICDSATSPVKWT